MDTVSSPQPIPEERIKELNESIQKNMREHPTDYIINPELQKFLAANPQVKDFLDANPQLLESLVANPQVLANPQAQELMIAKPQVLEVLVANPKALEFLLDNPHAHDLLVANPGNWQLNDGKIEVDWSKQWTLPASYPFPEHIPHMDAIYKIEKNEDLFIIKGERIFKSMEEAKIEKPLPNPLDLFKK